MMCMQCTIEFSYQLFLACNVMYSHPSSGDYYCYAFMHLVVVDLISTEVTTALYESTSTTGITNLDIIF